MVIPTEYGVLTVGVWLAVAAGIGLYALISALRRQTVPMTPSVVAFSMAAGSIWFFPDIYMDYSAITILNVFTIFISIDLFLISLTLRFRKNISKA